MRPAYQAIVQRRHDILSVKPHVATFTHRNKIGNTGRIKPLLYPVGATVYVAPMPTVLSRNTHLGKLMLPVLIVGLAACADEPQLLNSERIEQRFGSFGIDVLASEPGMRVSNLYSFDTAFRCVERMRSYASLTSSTE